MTGYKHLLITKHISVWSRLFMDDIPWAVVMRSLSVVMAVNLSLFVIGAAVFQSRDLKS
jgi:ABC-2 type transport system permease protein